MAATGVTRDLFTVPVLELSFALALGAYLDGFGVHDRPPMRPVVLHFVLQQALALLASVGSPDCPGYLLGFVVLVLEFNDKLPLSRDSSLAHAYTLYRLDSLNTRYCINLFWIPSNKTSARLRPSVNA
jgi:hypothetical protein